MTLEELQAEFPHGSRWRGGIATEYKVVDWDPERETVTVIYPRPTAFRCDIEFFSLRQMRLFERIQDPTPCPITEPETIYRTEHGFWWSHKVTDWQNRDAITLHPDGRYTWKGGPE